MKIAARGANRCGLVHPAVLTLNDHRVAPVVNPSSQGHWVEPPILNEGPAHQVRERAEHDKRPVPADTAVDYLFVRMLALVSHALRATGRLTT